MSFDLADYEGLEDEEYVIEIDNPKTGEPTGIKVTVAGSMGEFARLGQRILAQKVANAQKAGVDMKVLDDPNLSDSDPKVVEAARIESEVLLAMMKPRVQGWEGMTWNGKDVPYSAGMKDKIFGNIKFYWLAHQLFLKVEARASFTTASSKNSAKPSKPESSSTGQTQKD